MTAVGGSSTLFRALALVARPFVIFFGVTGLGWVLLRSMASASSNVGVSVGTDPASSAGDGSYLDWLTNLFRPGEGLFGIADAVEITAQVAVAGTIVGAVIGAGLAWLMRLGRIGPVVRGLSAPMMSFAGPGLVLAISYWLGVRFGAVPLIGSTSLIDDPAEAFRQLIGPALAVGAGLAPSIAAMVAAGAPYTEPFGLAAAASGLASRSVQRSNWRFGFPAGMMTAGLLVTELAFNRAGVFQLAIRSLELRDVAVTMNALAAIVLGGALLALVVDIAGLSTSNRTTPTAASLRLAGYQSMAPTWVYWAGAGALMVVVGLAVLAGPGGTTLVPDPQQARIGPFSEGHLLGTDNLGRDLLRLALGGLGPALVAAFVPSFFAVIVGYLLETLKRDYLGSLGELVPGTLIDALWWPLPLLMAIGALSAGDGDGPTLTSATVLVLVALGLVPLACRVVRRETVGPDTGEALRLVGVWALLAGITLTAYLATSFAGFGNPLPPGLGLQMGQGMSGVAQSAWSAGVPGVVSMLLAAATFTLGACLVRLGWYHSAATAAASTESDTADLTTPIRISGEPIVDSGPLTPNYDLQPGLPSTKPWDPTVTMPTPVVPPHDRQ